MNPQQPTQLFGGLPDNGSPDERLRRVPVGSRNRSLPT